MTGSEIECLRKGLRMSREEFANLVGVSFMTIYRWERGKTRIPKTASMAFGLIKNSNKSAEKPSVAA